MLVELKLKVCLLILSIVLLNVGVNDGRSLTQEPLYSNELDSQGSLRKLPMQKRPSASSTTSQKARTKKFPLRGKTLLILPFIREEIPNDWCKTRSFQQKIHHHGCNSTYVTNNVCVGQCLSVFIPNHFSSCSHCAPVVKEVINVQLDCPGLAKPVVKKVSIVKSCKCIPCGKR